MNHYIKGIIFALFIVPVYLMTTGCEKPDIEAPASDVFNSPSLPLVNDSLLENNGNAIFTTYPDSLPYYDLLKESDTLLNKSVSLALVKSEGDLIPFSGLTAHNNTCPPKTAETGSILGYYRLSRSTIALKAEWMEDHWEPSNTWHSYSIDNPNLQFGFKAFPSDRIMLNLFLKGTRIAPYPFHIWDPYCRLFFDPIAYPYYADINCYDGGSSVFTYLNTQWYECVDFLDLGFYLVFEVYT